MRFFRAAVVIGTLLFSSLTPVLVSADNSYGLEEASKQVPAFQSGVAGQHTVEGVVGQVIKIILSFLGIVFFGLIFYAGLTWMIARGNSEKIDQAKEIIVGSSIGLVLVMAAYAIAQVVFSRLTGGAQ